MKLDVKKITEYIKEDLELIKLSINVDSAKDKIKEIEKLSTEKDFWDNANIAQKLMREKKYHEKNINKYFELENNLNDNLDLLDIAEDENDENLLNETEKQLTEMEKEVKELRILSLLSGEADKNDCFLEIRAGAGGTESCDWAAMLLRMYTRWCDKKSFKYKIVDQLNGDEAGIKSVAIEINGENAFGWLKTESGVHRLVRISPFDSNDRRHTSFASVNVYPKIDDDIKIEVLDKDIKVDTFRASGAGGQHVNTTDSAVRITHKLSGIVVQCQNQRSQHKNKDEALKMLKAKLYEKELRKREEKAANKYENKEDNGWGSQIRSYVLQPYQMVKDLRTGVEKGNAQGVLDGDLDDYMSAALLLNKR